MKCGRTGAHILEIFGGVALFLAIIGLYAINAYTMARRTREIGIRMALGADASSTLQMILKDGLGVTAIGTGIGFGLLLAIGIGRLLAGFLYDVPNIDPVVIAAVSAVLVAWTEPKLMDHAVFSLACHLRLAGRVT